MSQIEESYDELVMNITNPSSIYIQGTLWFSGYRKISLHCYVDTGASICLANKYVIPPEHWENAERPIKVKTANGIITIDKVCKNLDMIIAGTSFHIPTAYQQNAGMDFIIGNNFCLLYSPCIFHLKQIVLHTLEKKPVWVDKVFRAEQRGLKGFLDSRKIGSKKRAPDPVNISSQRTLFLERGREKLEAFRNKQKIENHLVFSINLRNEIENLLEKVCSDNPLDPSRTKNWMTASIKLIDPRKVCKVKPMKYSPQDREEFAKQIKELLDMKIIIPSKSAHMSPAFLVENEAEKRRGKKRMVVNYKKMNDLTIGDGHNLPNKDELLTLIRGKKVFSSLDCKSGFWQVLLDEDSQLLTAFTCPQGHYQWRVLPFGFKQAPSIFQRHMQNALNIYEKFCCVYVDDILIFSDNEEDHQRHLATVLKKCEQLGIILSKKKAQLFRTKINFLGLEIDQGTHCPQNHILEHIAKFPDRIEDKKQLQRFLGILTYASDYIPGLASKRAPLQVKLKKDMPWNWIASDTLYVAKLKKGLVNFPKLYHPNVDEKLIIETDASQDYWGGILKAENADGKELICRYASGSFKAAETRYHSNEKEYLAVIRVIKKFTIYLTPVHFTVRTDNKNFTHFMNLQIQGDNKQGRLVRWQQWLSHYSFTVEHLEGSKNVFADFLTREFYPSKEA
nr:reverse transcriptase [Angelica bushy stunt virus]